MYERIVVLAQEGPADRAANLGKIVLYIIGLIALVGILALLGMLAHRLEQMGWPLWLSGGIGLVVLIVGYVAGSVRIMQTGGVIMAASLGIALFGAMTSG